MKMTESLAPVLRAARTQKTIQIDIKNKNGKPLTDEEIGKMVGYPDPNYFTKVFRRVRGISPSVFRDTAGSQRGEHI